MSPSQEQTLDRVNHPSRQVLTAGLENQQTIAINDLQGGVFTRALLDGLEGHADTEKGNFKKDGVVTARELEAYVRERVDHERRRVGWQSKITPVLYDFRNYEGDFFFVSDKQKLSKGALLPSRTTPIEGVVATGVKKPLNRSNARFYDNGDGTITDNVTRLMWKKCRLGQNNDACSGTEGLYSYPQAEKLSTNYKLANYNDWRLPKTVELFSLCSKSLSTRLGESHSFFDIRKRNFVKAYIAEPYTCDNENLEYKISSIFPNMKVDHYWTTKGRGSGIHPVAVSFRSGVFSEIHSLTFSLKSFEKKGGVFLVRNADRASKKLEESPINIVINDTVVGFF